MDPSLYNARLEKSADLLPGTWDFWDMEYQAL